MYLTFLLKKIIIITARAPLVSINQLVPHQGNSINNTWTNRDCFHGSRMEGFLSTFPTYNVYANPVCGPPAQGSGWGKREGRFMTPQGLNYLELCKAILSQVNPNLPPALKKANTKECGVQVNAKVDKTVQCSLGPKTLFGLESDRPDFSKSPKSPDQFGQDGKTLCSTPPVSNLRFMRPVSIYSPVFDRRIFLRKLNDAGELEEEAEVTEAGKCDKDAEADPSGDYTLKDFKTTFHQASKGSNFQVGSSLGLQLKIQL